MIEFIIIVSGLFCGFILFCALLKAFFEFLTSDVSEDWKKPLTDEQLEEMRISNERHAKEWKEISDRIKKECREKAE
ncbi:MAG: hypothetical protein ACI3Y0_07315 [Prevotella sp.]